MKYGDIVLRALEPEDLEILYKWENNMDIWLVSNTIAPFSKYILKKYIDCSHQSIYESGQLRFIIDLPGEKVPIGTIDIFDFDQYHQRAGVGILIAEEQYRHKGYALKSLQAVIDYCFNTLLLHQLYCNILSNNRESMELFKKAGFAETGIKHEWIKTNEGYLDQHLFQLINQ